MRIGVPREIKVHEYRVGLTPVSVRELAIAGHEVLVQSGAGAAIGMDDGQYLAAGARITSVDEVFAQTDMVVKVKEPQPQECARLRSDQILFTYLHLAPDPAQASALLASGACCIAYETVTGPGSTLPLLQPMSAVAGRMAIQVAACHLEKPHGGRGVLLGGVPGVEAGRVVILGAGVVGTNALQMAVGLGSQVTVIDRSHERLRDLDLRFGNRIATRLSSHAVIEESILSADAVIGAVLVPGAKAPHLIDRGLVSRMTGGSVLVDVAIDQGGCFETSRPTTHSEPTFVVDGVVHYCVANMPGAVPRTSTLALNNATLPRVLALAQKGWRQALLDDPHLRQGLNLCQGQITHAAVAQALGMDYTPPEALLN